jgi:hypothetical protein
MQQSTQKIVLDIIDSGQAAGPQVPLVPNTGDSYGLLALIAQADPIWLFSAALVIGALLILLLSKLNRFNRHKRMAFFAVFTPFLLGGFIITGLYGDSSISAQTSCSERVCIDDNGDLRVEIDKNSVKTGDVESVATIATDNPTGYTLSSSLSQIAGDFVGIGATISGEDITNPVTIDSSVLTIKTTTTAPTDNSANDQFTIGFDIADSASVGSREFSLNYAIDANFAPQATSCVATDATSDDFTIDKDANMIPVSFTGDATTPKWSIAHDGNWCAYTDKQWANAVTVVAEKVDNYKNASAGEVVPEADVLGYWVYIPRYAYNVTRFGVGGVSSAYPAVMPTNFDIVFQKSGADSCDATVRPADGSTTVCYPSGNNQWYTHPAFQVYGKPLNGLWAGKFETTGSVSAPTIKPNLVSQGYLGIGTHYDVAKSMGKYAMATGNGTVIEQNNHNLAEQATRMMRNSEWGAVAYLSASAFGAGVNNVQINANASHDLVDGNGVSDPDSTGVTGCGPNELDSTDAYDGGLACQGVSDSSYFTNVGVLASTTNNVYGIYDMAGGADEYVAGFRGTASSPQLMATWGGTDFGYFDVYPSNVFNSSGKSLSDGTNRQWFENVDKCQPQYCLGHAISETKLTNWNYIENWLPDYAPFERGATSWGTDFSYFPFSDASPVVVRGGYAFAGRKAGIFAHGNGRVSADSFASRVVLTPFIEY